MQPNYRIRPNAHKCYQGEGRDYIMVLGYGSFLCSMCADPRKSIDLVLDEVEIQKIKDQMYE